jgi:NADPH:quinone reductase-like Zn-dependent oxidoreductase
MRSRVGSGLFVPLTDFRSRNRLELGTQPRGVESQARAESKRSGWRVFGPRNRATHNKGTLMKAILHTHYGPPDLLQFKEVDKPVPKNNEVLIKIHATTVSTGDCNVRNFTFVTKSMRPIARLMFGIGKPWKERILGTELAGKVAGTGKDVRKFKVGDRVVASTGMAGGGHAQYACLAEKGALVIKPDSLSWEEAVAIPFGANTALYFLRNLGKIQAGQELLIIGASGSIGSAGVQLAKHFGAMVTAVCSAANVEMVKSLGADKVIDYTKEDFTKNGKTYDLIFDIVGATTFDRCQKSLKTRGVFLQNIMGLDDMVRVLWTSITGRKKVKGGVAMENLERMNFTVGLATAGKLKAVIDRSYPLERIAEAFKYVEQGHKKGNVVITVEHS